MCKLAKHTLQDRSSSSCVLWHSTQLMADYLWQLYDQLSSWNYILTQTHEHRMSTNNMEEELVDLEEKRVKWDVGSVAGFWLMDWFFLYVFHGSSCTRAHRGELCCSELWLLSHISVLVLSLLHTIAATVHKWYFVLNICGFTLPWVKIAALCGRCYLHWVQIDTLYLKIIVMCKLCS